MCNLSAAPNSSTLKDIFKCHSPSARIWRWLVKDVSFVLCDGAELSVTLSLSLSEVMRRRGGSLLCPGWNYDNKRKQSYYWHWAFIMQMILKQAAWMASGYRLISMQWLQCVKLSHFDYDMLITRHVCTCTTDRCTLKQKGATARQISVLEIKTQLIVN